MKPPGGRQTYKGRRRDRGVDARPARAAASTRPAAATRSPRRRRGEDWAKIDRGRIKSAEALDNGFRSVRRAPHLRRDVAGASAHGEACGERKTPSSNAAPRRDPAPSASSVSISDFVLPSGRAAATTPSVDAMTREDGARGWRACSVLSDLRSANSFVGRLALADASPALDPRREQRIQKCSPKA